MDNDFFYNIIQLLNRSDIQFYSTELRQVKFDYDKGITNVAMELSEFFNQEPPKFSKVPVIPCLIVFTLFDAYLENKYRMTPGMSFKQKYNSLKDTTNHQIIEKECYRLMKTIRNGYVHNISSIVSDNGLFHFNYVTPKGTSFNLDISTTNLNLLYSIILILVEGKYDIPTQGHFENILCTYYNELKESIDSNGNFKDDIHNKLLPVLDYVKLNSCVRYPVLNTDYNIDNGRININSIYDPEYSIYSSDYCIKYNNKKYIIPQEILDSNNSVRISDLAVWED